MKKIALFAFAVALLTTSCKEEKNTETPIVEPTPEVVTGLKIVTDSTKVNWTAFKTTEKIAVGASFQSIELKEVKTGETPEEVLEGVAFTIPVSSIFTNNPDRDAKILEFFFGTLKNTELLSGILNFREGKCYLTLTMNDVTKEIVTEYTYENKLFTLTSTLNLAEFGGEKAIAAINKACYELHKGKDGVSKTWELVDIKGSVLFE
uniref:YceI family protein n=1 Tax=Flavobacterium sp. TaxID=239 RepID=UPI00404B0C3F